MAITDKMIQLGHAARRLNDGSDKLNRLISKIDTTLGRLMIGMPYTHPRPISESVTFDADGKRVIEVAYLSYQKIRDGYHLAVKTVKVLESKKALGVEAPGSVHPLIEAPRKLRYAAIDVLPDLVSGLATQVDDIVNKMERRCDVAESLLRHLEQMVDPHAPVDPAPMADRFKEIADASTSQGHVVRRAEPAGVPEGPRKRSRTHPQGSL